MKFEKSKGLRYEDTYGGWLEFFQEMAENPQTVIEAPVCWYPFIRYLGGDVCKPIESFPEDILVHSPIVEFVKNAILEGNLRTVVEMYSTLRPELVDALYKSDVEWKTHCKLRMHEWKSEFNVTNNGSFHRPEVLDYLDRLHSAYQKPEHKRQAVLVPCAADKPYPAPLHVVVERMLPDDAHLIVATGVLGLVPRELFTSMPLYDSGLPNQWRLMNEVTRYFSRYQYDRVIVYCDFYNQAIMQGLQELPESRRPVVFFVNPFVNHYLNLLSPERLGRLEDTLRSF